MKKLLFIISLFSLISISYADLTSEEDVIQELQEWVIALSKDTPDHIVNLYKNNSVLLATFNRNPILTEKERTKYFTNLMELNNLRVVINEIYTIDLYDDIAVSSGLYTFIHDDKNDEAIELPARFTFVHNKLTGEIFAHHSSLLPVSYEEN